MRRVKKRTFSGVVCEQEVYDIPDRIKDVRNAKEEKLMKELGLEVMKNDYYSKKTTP